MARTESHNSVNLQRRAELVFAPLLAGQFDSFVIAGRGFLPVGDDGELSSESIKVSQEL